MSSMGEIIPFSNENRNGLIRYSWFMQNFTFDPNRVYERIWFVHLKKRSKCGLMCTKQ